MWLFWVEVDRKRCYCPWWMKRKTWQWVPVNSRKSLGYTWETYIPVNWKIRKKWVTCAKFNIISRFVNWVCFSNLNYVSYVQKQQVLWWRCNIKQSEVHSLHFKPFVVVLTCNPSTGEAEQDGLSWTPAWPVQRDLALKQTKIKFNLLFFVLKSSHML